MAFPAGAKDGTSNFSRGLGFDGGDAGGTGVADLVIEEGRVGVAGHDENHINASTAQFNAESVAEGADGEFAGAVNRVLGRGDDTEDAADVDDLAPALALHVRQDGLGAADHAENIDVDEALGVGELSVSQLGAEAKAGVVDENVHPSKLGNGGFDEAVDVVVASDVGGNGEEKRVSGSEFAQLGLITCGQNNSGPGSGEGQRGLAPDAAGSAGNDDNQVVEVFFGCHSSCLMIYHPVEVWQCIEGNMSAPIETDRPKILAIDDEENLLDIMKTALEDEGFSVLTAATPDAGLALYERQWRDIRLVLIDYLMPDMNGDAMFELMQRINPDVRALLVTACDDNVAKSMFARGLRGFLAKPFYLDDLIRRVRDEVEAG